MHHVEDCDGTKMKAIKHFFSPHCKTQPEEGWKVNVTNSSPAWTQRRGLVCPDVVPPLKECAATINIRINAPFIYFFKPVFNVLPRLTASRTCCKEILRVESFYSSFTSKNLSVFHQQRVNDTSRREHPWRHRRCWSSSSGLLWMESFLPLRSHPRTSLTVTDLSVSLRVSSALFPTPFLSTPFWALHCLHSALSDTHSCLSSPVE